MLVGFGVDLECQDNEGHACPVAFGSGGWRRWTVEVVVGKGANVKAKSSRAGATLYVQLKSSVIRGSSTSLEGNTLYTHSQLELLIIFIPDNRGYGDLEWIIARKLCCGTSLCMLMEKTNYQL